ncbi:MAG: hypothetical protein ACFHXK_11325 [bacterium]
MQQSIKGVVAGTVVLSLIIPPGVFLWVALTSGMPVAESVSALFAQYLSRKQNLLMVSLLSLLPVVLMVLLAWLIPKAKRLAVSGRDLALGGAAGIVLVNIWMNVEYWPTFLPEMTYAGFPHGLEFVIGPIFHAPVAMAVGMFAVGLARRRRVVT